MILYIFEKIMKWWTKWKKLAFLEWNTFCYVKKWKEIPFKKNGIFLCILSKSRNFWVKEICDMDKGQGMMYT